MGHDRLASAASCWAVVRFWFSATSGAGDSAVLLRAITAAEGLAGCVAAFIHERTRSLFASRSLRDSRPTVHIYEHGVC